MPEGHTVRRLAGLVTRTFGDQVVEVTSPQGRFAGGAALLDGTRLVRTDAHGKHLLVGFASSARPEGARRTGQHPVEHWLHVHLGLYGKWTFGDGEPPAVRGALRLRLATEAHWADLRGPTACEVLDDEEVALLHDRLGPDPLRRDGDRELFVTRAKASRTAVAALLMRQDVLAGVGNVYRAEVLFRARLAPLTPGRDVPAQVLADIWDDLVVLMRAGVRAGRIVTTAPADRGGARGRLGAHYVYGRTGAACRICGTAVSAAPLAGRTLYWCPTCQRPEPSASWTDGLAHGLGHAPVLAENGIWAPVPG